MSDSVKQLRELEAKQSSAKQWSFVDAYEQFERSDFLRIAFKADFAAIAAELEALRAENAELRAELSVSDPRFVE